MEHAHGYDLCRSAMLPDQVADATHFMGCRLRTQCNDRGVQCKGRSRGSYSDNVFDHKPWGFIYMRQYMWDLIIITEPHAVPRAYLLCRPTVPSYLTVPPSPPDCAAEFPTVPPPAVPSHAVPPGTVPPCNTITAAHPIFQNESHHE